MATLTQKRSPLTAAVDHVLHLDDNEAIRDAYARLAAAAKTEESLIARATAAENARREGDPDVALATAIEPKDLGAARIRHREARRHLELTIDRTRRTARREYWRAVGPAALALYSDLLAVLAKHAEFREADRMFFEATSGQSWMTSERFALPAIEAVIENLRAGVKSNMQE